MSGKRKKIVLTGREGQVARALLEHAGRTQEFEIEAVGRPEFDLSFPDQISRVIHELRPDIIVSAAAYTAVDQAESDEDLAQIVNGHAPGKIAQSAAALNIPIIHISTDYVFDGTGSRPYVESDPVAPLGAYGRSKLAGERAVAAANRDHLILRTAWVYSPFGRNFVKTMLRLAENRDEIGVVNDQIGNPTSASDIAVGIVSAARQLLENGDPTLRGVFHMAGTGGASWADVAVELFECSRKIGGPFASVKRISSSQYPTPAKRPANSRLDCGKLERIHGIKLPDWRLSIATVVERVCGNAL